MHHLSILCISLARAAALRDQQYQQQEPKLNYQQHGPRQHHQHWAGQYQNQQRRERRSALPHASPGNVIEPLLAACRAGAQRDVNAKCRDMWVWQHSLITFTSFCFLLFLDAFSSATLSISFLCYPIPYLYLWVMGKKYIPNIIPIFQNFKRQLHCHHYIFQ